MRKIIQVSFIFSLLSFFININGHVQAEELKINNDLLFTESYSIPIYESTNNNGVQLKAIKKVADINFHLNPKLTRIYYTIVMKPGYGFLSFNGAIRITNLSSGFSEGTVDIRGIKGSIPVPTYKHHIYMATVSGMVLSTNGPAFTIPSGAYLKWESIGR